MHNTKKFLKMLKIICWCSKKYFDIYYTPTIHLGDINEIYLQFICIFVKNALKVRKCARHGSANLATWLFENVFNFYYMIQEAVLKTFHNQKHKSSKVRCQKKLTERFGLALRFSNVSQIERAALCTLCFGRASSCKEDPTTKGELQIHVLNVVYQ